MGVLHLAHRVRIPLDSYKSPMAVVILRATTTEPTDVLKITINQSRSNPTRCASNLQEGKKKETGMSIRGKKQKISNKRADLSTDTDTVALTVNGLNRKPPPPLPRRPRAGTG